MSTPTVVSTITDAASGVTSNVLPIAAAGLGVGVLVFSVKRGWGWFRSLSKG